MRPSIQSLGQSTWIVSIFYQYNIFIEKLEFKLLMSFHNRTLVMKFFFVKMYLMKCLSYLLIEYLFSITLCLIKPLLTKSLQIWQAKYLVQFWTVEGQGTLTKYVRYFVSYGQPRSVPLDFPVPTHRGL